MVANQMAQQMAEPGNVARASGSEVAANQMAQQMAEPGNVARAPIEMVGGNLVGNSDFWFQFLGPPL